MSAPAGVLLVDKPVGPSSAAAVARVRRALGERRVGHAGTLDPAASGLLVLGVGSGTRLLTFLVGLDKAYDATIRLGIATDSDDAEGVVLSAVGCGAEVRVEPALAQLRGSFRQRPAAVSAIKVAGRRSYQRVRSGEDVVLPARPVTVTAFEVRDRRTSTAGATPVVDLDVSVTVSSGTYVRALARDLGDLLGVGGHLTALRRLRVGPFDVADAVPWERLGPDARLLDLGAVARQVLPTVVLDGQEARAAAHGLRLPCDGTAEPTALIAPDGGLVAVATCRDGRWKYHFVVAGVSDRLDSDSLERP